MIWYLVIYTLEADPQRFEYHPETWNDVLFYLHQWNDKMARFILTGRKMTNYEKKKENAIDTSLSGNIGYDQLTLKL